MIARDSQASSTGDARRVVPVPAWRDVLARLIRPLGPVRGATRLKRMLVPGAICRHAGLETCAYPRSFGVSAKWQGSSASFLGWHVIYCGWHELETHGVMAHFLKPGMRVIEAGANEGYHTIFAAALVGKAGRVTAYEPSPRERDRLIANVALNRFEDRVVVRDLALSDFSGNSSFLVPLDNEWNRGVGSLPEHYESKEKVSSIDVRVATLDTEELGDCDFMKLDVQGAEASILRGASALLERCKPVVYFEVEGSQRGAVSFLEGLGYKIWRVIWIRRRPYYGLSTNINETGRQVSLNCLALPAKHSLHSARAV